MQTIQSFVLDESRVCFLEKTTPFYAIKKLVETLPEESCHDIEKKVLERESICRTSIGKGLALPHARCEFLDDFHLTIGICKEGIEWQSLDGEPVKIVCLIAGPEDKQREYLSFLSFITGLLKEDQVRNTLLTEEDKKNIVNIFRSC